MARVEYDIAELTNLHAKIPTKTGMCSQCRKERPHMTQFEEGTAFPVKLEPWCYKCYVKDYIKEFDERPLPRWLKLSDVSIEEPLQSLELSEPPLQEQMPPGPSDELPFAP